MLINNGFPAAFDSFFPGGSGPFSRRHRLSRSSFDV